MHSTVVELEYAQTALASTRAHRTMPTEDSSRLHKTVETKRIRVTSSRPKRGLQMTRARASRSTANGSDRVHAAQSST